jgi:hypothetical protein
LNINVRSNVSKRFGFYKYINRKEMRKMLKIKKIQRKLEIKDVAVQNDPCYHWYVEGYPGQYDCLVDCEPANPYASELY